ncbi:MAG: TetR/AcrR family transcriptional regulator, partial [Alphaproteobacteria bacterium]
MPYTAEHKEQTRRRIISSARRLFNRHGFTGVSIDQIMAGAGLTRGGFYNHFRTKDELYAEAVGQVLSCDMSQDWEGYDLDPAAPPALLARQVIAAYVSDRHFSDVEASCPLMAVPSDVARGGTLVKEAYGKVLEAMVGL